MYGGRAGSLGASDEFTTGVCASRKVRVLLPASTAPARDARLFSRQRWICPRERDVDVLHRSTHTVHQRRTMASSKSEIRSQLSERPQREGHAERYRRHDDDGGEVSGGCLLSFCLSCLEPVSAGNNAPHERVGGLKMSNQICRPKSKGGSCELYGTPFRHRPVRLRKTAPAPEIRWKHHHPIPHNIIDTNRYVHMASLTLPLATSSLTPHRTHAAAPSRG